MRIMDAHACMHDQLHVHGNEKLTLLAGVTKNVLIRLQVQFLHGVVVNTMTLKIQIMH